MTTYTDELIEAIRSICQSAILTDCRPIEAALLAAKAEEREACAAWCETQADFKGDLNDGINGEIYRHCAWAIRARGAPAAVKEEQGS